MLLAWLFHGAINTLVFVNSAVDIVQCWWLSAAVYGVAALIVVLVTGSRSSPFFRISLDSSRYSLELP